VLSNESVAENDSDTATGVFQYHVLSG